MNFKLLVITLILIPGFVGSASALYAPLIEEGDITNLIHEMEGKAVLIRTHEGTFMIELFPVDAPNHVYRFLNMIESGYYEGTFFHRIIPEFMVQGGDPNTKAPETAENVWGTGGPNYEMKNEFNTIILPSVTPHIYQYILIAETLQKKNPITSGLSLCLQSIENKCLNALTNWFVINHYEIGALVYDGLLVRQNKHHKFNTASHYCAQQHILDKTGYNIKLIIKPFTPNNSPADVIMIFFTKVLCLILSIK